MVTKTYKCEEHGEFDWEFKTCNEKIEQCPICKKPVDRVYKKLTYMDSEGFCGKVYGCP